MKAFYRSILNKIIESQNARADRIRQQIQQGRYYWL